MNLDAGTQVTPIKSYSQQICEYGERLNVGTNYKVKSWYHFYGNTIVILDNGSHVLKQQLNN